VKVVWIQQQDVAVVALRHRTEMWVVVKVVYCHIVTDDLVKFVNLIKSALN